MSKGFFDSRVEFLTAAGEARSPLETIIPIGFHDPRADLFHPFGTGIFIGSRGIFCTAKHVFEFEPRFMDQMRHLSLDAYLSIYQYFPDHTAQERPIMDIHFHEKFDLAVAVCEPFNNLKTGEVFHNAQQALSERVLCVGEPVHHYSYPNPIIHTENENLQTLMIPLSTSGKVLDWLPNGMGSLFPSPAYVIEGYVGAGSSGGPVLDRLGKVVAVCSRGCEGGNYYYAIPIREISEIVLSSIGLSSEPKIIGPTVREMADRGLISFEG